MAEYIDRERLKEVFDRNVVSAGVFNDIIDAQPIVDAIFFSEDATNGDMIKAMFPNAKWWVNEDNEVFTDMPWKPEKCVYFDLDWWNALYKTEKWVNFAEGLKDVFEEEVKE